MNKTLNSRNRLEHNTSFTFFIFLAPECHEKDWFDHLEAHNNYNGGAMPRKVEAEKIRQKAVENAAKRASEEVAERADHGSSISRWAFK